MSDYSHLNQEQVWDLVAVKRRVILLAAAFKRAVDARRNEAAIILPQAEAAQNLREVSIARAGLIRTELAEIQNSVKLTQERVSLLLRYRSPSVDPDGQVSAHLIESDLRHAAQADQFASAAIASLGSYEPLTQEQQDDIMGAISVSLAETKRILIACMGPAMSEDDVTAFHSNYESPDNPLLSFQDKTETMQKSTLRLVEMTAVRVENTMDYVGVIDRIIVPAFPQHAESMKAQANEMLSEARGSFTRMQNLIDRAEDLYLQSKTPPVRGPSI